MVVEDPTLTTEAPQSGPLPQFVFILTDLNVSGTLTDSGGDPVAARGNGTGPGGTTSFMLMGPDGTFILPVVTGLWIITFTGQGGETVSIEVNVESTSVEGLTVIFGPD